MAAQVSAVSKSAPNHNHIGGRRLANFHPDVWGDNLLSSLASASMKIDDSVKERVEQLKEEVRRKLGAFDNDNPTQILGLIDSIQRLGVSYHFEIEIEDTLLKVIKTHSNNNDDDLCIVALRFRLLRQQGFNASSDVFNKFKDSEGNFNESLINDVRGLLSLYEATHFRVHGEDILEQALAFTTIHLQSIAQDLSHPLAAQVAHTLKQPLRKSLPRMEAKHFATVYQEDASHDESLLTFAKMDFNILQKLHQEELGAILRWYKDLGLASKLNYIRHRVVEGFFWSAGAYFEPQYSLGRMIFAKVITLASVVDDTYDAYATLEELPSFTDAIHRWDIGCMNELPEYMKFLYKTVLDVYEEIEEQLAKQGKSHHLHYAKEAMKKLVQAYLVEAKWSHEGYTPTVDEYMSIALTTAGSSILTITSYLGMGDVATKEVFEWASSNPKIFRAASVIYRLMNDIVSHEFEQQRGHVASAVECYMKDHGVSEEQACNELNKQIVNAWKDLNEEWLKPDNASMPLLTRVLNLARVMDLLYKDGDEYTHVGELMKSCVATSLILCHCES